MRGDVEIGARLVTSYELMLDFYGMELVDIDTGELRRSEQVRSCLCCVVRCSLKDMFITVQAKVQRSHYLQSAQPPPDRTNHVFSVSVGVSVLCLEVTETPAARGGWVGEHCSSEPLP